MAKSLSILMAIQNGARFLPRTLDALFSQISPEHEVIAVDDGSSDDSARILSQYSLDLHRFPSPRGLAHARNLALQKASGRYVTFLDQDDLLTPGALSRRMNYLDQHPPTVGVAGEIAGLIGENNELLGDFYQLSGTSRSEAPLKWSDIQQGASIPGALWLYMFRRDFLIEMQPFDPQWGALCDQEFLYRALQHSPIARQPIPVAHYRIHANNSTVHWDKGHLHAHPRTKALGVLLKMKYRIC